MTEKTDLSVDKAKVELQPLEAQPVPNCGKGKSILKKNFKVLVGLLLLLIMLTVVFKEKVLVAIVNGKPIFRTQLNRQLTKIYGRETLENLIIEDLIRSESKKNNIVVSDQDIDKEIEKVSQNLAEGVKIEDALRMQGISMADFRSQIKLNLEINKLLEKDIDVSNEEIEAYIKDSGKTLTATSEAEKRDQATNILKQQKFGERMQSWVGELLAKAKITRFLK